MEDNMKKNREMRNFRNITIDILSMLLLVTYIGFSQGNPIPTLSAINPSSCELGTPGFTISIFGSNFSNQSAVKFDIYIVTPTYLSPSEMEAYIPGEYLNNVGTFEMVIVNPAPGGGNSQVKLFTIYGSNQSIISISPQIMIANTSNLSLVVAGTNFSTRSAVRFNNINRSTTFDGSSQLTAQLEPKDLTVPGDYPISVLNTETGVITNSLKLSIVFPVPVIESIDPSSKNPGEAAFIMTIKGLNFVSLSKVLLDVEELPTTFVNSTTLTAEVNADYLVEPANSYDVRVSTTGPGGSESNSISLTVSKEVPIIVNISPTRMKAGGRNTLLKVEGSNFTEKTVGQFNGSPRQTTYISSTVLMVNILESDLKTPGQYPVTINNNQSKAKILTVYATKQIVVDQEVPIVNSSSLENYFIANNYSNPFNPATVINFVLPQASTVTMKVYNSLGQMVSTLLDHTELQAGEQNVSFVANNLTSGEYFYHIVSTDVMGQHFSSIKKMILIK
jgi:hypothetical protein